MLKMVNIESIRKMFFMEGLSIRAICRNTGYSRQTIRKALESAEIPRYILRAQRPQPVMGTYLDVIRHWLAQDEQAPKKQRHTARRVYDRLVEEYGFSGGQSTVRGVVRDLRNRPKEAFVPQMASYGEEAQADFGSAIIMIGDVETRVSLFCLRLRASGVPFVYAYPSERLECFLDGHARAFEALGVPLRCRYDNTRVAITKLFRGGEREENQLFSSLRAHYLFDSEFCNPRKGNEKGSVENLVGYVRRNALVPVPQVASLEELNAILARWCEREKVRLAEQWKVEQQALRPATHRFRACVPNWGIVNTLCLVTHNRVRYSVPSHLVGQQVRVDAFPERIEIYHGESLVASHQRSFVRGETVLDPRHYLEVVALKKRAASRALFLKDMPEAFGRARSVLGLGTDGYREFASILLLAREFSLTQVTQALEKALELGRPTALVVRQLILAAQHRETQRVVVPVSLQTATVPLPDLARYDHLLRGVSV